MMWWDKPFDVSSPTELQGKDLGQILAFVSLVDEMNLKRDQSGLKYQLLFTKYSPRTEIDGLEHKCITLECQDWNTTDESIRPLVQHTKRAPVGHIRIRPGQQLLSTGLYLNDISNSELVLGAKDVERWILAAEMYKDLYDYLYRDLGDRKLGPLIQKRSENWPLTLKISSEDFDMTQWIIFVLAGVIYGGLHAVAWNASFTSMLEQSMWRGSALTIMPSGLIGLLIILSRNYIVLLWEKKKSVWKSNESSKEWLAH